ncbi:MAG: hypothetical protein ACJ8BW_20345 [Ktedonobacteraceae bacterium]
MFIWTGDDPNENHLRIVGMLRFCEQHIYLAKEKWYGSSTLSEQGRQHRKTSSFLYCVVKNIPRVAKKIKPD